MVAGNDQAVIVLGATDGSDNQELCEPIRGAAGVARKGSGSSAREDAGDAGR